jgi:murein DD-endopeptidase MepM/ murein hydrolase activator NlpD
MIRLPYTKLMLPLLGVLVLVLPTASAAAEESTVSVSTSTSSTSAVTKTTTTTVAPETSSTPAPPSTNSTSSTTVPAPAPEAPANTPQVQAQTPQVPSLPSPIHHSGAHDNTNHTATTGTGTQGAEKEPKLGAVPLPSALTPPFPGSLGSSISGVPNFFIESFRIPPFLLPIYQAAGTAYGIPWQVLAAINEVETDYGRDLSVSSAGAEGWMQFLPSSWAQYAVDANGDGFEDPYNPADAIFTAARYLKAAGGEKDIKGAVFSYNHSQSYVDSVMLRAQLLGGTPPELLSAITGLTEAHFPVHAAARFSDGFATVAATPGKPAATLVGTTIYAQSGAPVIAVQDGTIVAIGDSPMLGHYVSLRDAYGNTYTYAQLGETAALYPVLKPHDNPAGSKRIAKPGAPLGPAPSAPASAGVQPRSPVSEAAVSSGLALGAAAGLESAATPQPVPAPVAPPVLTPPTAPAETPRVFRSGSDDVFLHPLHVGVQVIAGTVLGHIGTAGNATAPATGQAEPHMLFQLRPAGREAPLIDPKPILDGWVQLENSSIFRAKGENPFLASSPTVGQVLLESKQQLEQQVLSDSGISIYSCGRQDIQTGQIDRRVLATLEFLSVSGLKPTVSALKCGHSELTTEGNISEHSTGDAVDISAINGVPIVGHQGPGSITDTTIRKLLMLQGVMKPHQIISLMSYPGTDNTLSMPDHYNHIHIGFRPLGGAEASSASSFSSTLAPSQWIRLISRLGEIPDPNVAGKPSTAAIADPATASSDTTGDSGVDH